MKEFKFGIMPKKTVGIDEEGNIIVQSKLYGNGEYNVEKIKAIFVKKPTFTDGSGTLYLSFSEDDSVDNPVLQKNGFQYTRKQEVDLEEFIGLIQGFNEELEVKGGSAVKSKKEKKEKIDRHAIRCTKCKSTNVEFLDNKRKGFSTGKAVGGAVLTGGVGALAGFAGKKGKDRWHCKDCGRTFEKKS